MENAGEQSMALLEEGLSSSSGESSSDVSGDEADPSIAFGPDLFGDDEDRARLMAMPELAREQILLKRQEMLVKSKERSEAQAKWRLEQRRQRNALDDDHPERTSTRAKRQKKPETSKEKAIQDIRGRRSKQISARQSEVVREYDSEDDEWEEETAEQDDKEYAEEGSGYDSKRMHSSLSPPPQMPFDPLSVRTDANDPIDHETMKSVQLRRGTIEALVDEPFFNDITCGMFVRIGLGTNDITGEHVYRAVVIVDIVDYPRSYAIGSRETSKALRVAFGASERTFKITQVSTHSITSHEAGQWVRAQRKDNLPVITIGQAITMKLAAEKLRRTFKYTPAMVDEMVQKKNQLRAGRSHNMTQQKLLLQRDLQMAIEDNDYKRQAEIESRLDTMQEYIRTMKRRQDDSVDALNDKIRQANKLIDIRGDMNALQIPEPGPRRRSTPSTTPTNAADEERPIGRLQCKYMNSSLRRLIMAHDYPLSIDVHAVKQPALRKNTYIELHPNSVKVPLKFSDRGQFQQTLTLKEWRQQRGLE